MPTTLDELESFHRFAMEKLGNGGADLTLEECVGLWRKSRDEAETIEAIVKGVADIEAGRCYSLDEVDAEIRRRFDESGRLRPHEL